MSLWIIMVNSIRDSLYEIVNEYGIFSIKEIKKLKSLLLDYSKNNNIKEISALLCVLNEGCVKSLLSLDNNYQDCKEKILFSISQNSPISEEYLLWAIDSWAMALNIIPKNNNDFSPQRRQ